MRGRSRICVRISLMTKLIMNDHRIYTSPSPFDELSYNSWLFALQVFSHSEAFCADSLLTSTYTLQPPLPYEATTAPELHQLTRFRNGTFSQRICPIFGDSWQQFLTAKPSQYSFQGLLREITKRSQGLDKISHFSESSYPFPRIRWFR
jgi:hypothetical protein